MDNNARGKRYDEEFKKDTVKYFRESGKSVAAVAKELGLGDATLYAWVAKYNKPKVEPVKEQRNSAPQNPPSDDTQKKIKELEAENGRLQKEIQALLQAAREMGEMAKGNEEMLKENEVLKNMVRYFAKNI